MATQETNLRARITLVDRLSPALKSMQKNMRVASRNMGEGFDRLASIAGQLGKSLVSLAATGAGTWYATLSAAEMATQLRVLSDRAGVSVERMQAWQSAAESMGIQGQDLADALKDMNKELTSAAVGGKEELAQLLAKVGISARDASGQIKLADKVFLDFADAIASQKSEALQLRMAQAAFGEDTGIKLLPALRKGSAAFRDAEDAIRASGHAINDLQIDRLQSFQASWKGLMSSFDASRAQVFATLAPSMEKLSVAAGKVLEKITPIVASNLDAVAEDLGRAIDSIDWDRVINALDVLTSSTDRMAQEWGFLGKMIAFVNDNFIAIVGVIAASKILKAFWSIGSGLFSVAQGFGVLVNALNIQAILPFFKALKSFDVFLANGLLKTVGVVASGISKFAIGLVKGWGLVSRVAVAASGLIVKAVTGLSKAFMAAGPVGVILTALSAAMLVWQLWGDKITEIVSKVWTAVQKFFGTMADWISDRIDSIKSVFESFSGALTKLVPDWLLNLFNGSDKKTLQVDADVQQSDPDFYRTNITSMDAPAIRRVAQTPVERQRVWGAVDVNFANAPASMNVAGVRSGGGMNVRSSVDYERQGRSAFAPAW